MTDNFKYLEAALPFGNGVQFLVYLHRRRKDNADLQDDLVDEANPDVLKGWWIVRSAEELQGLEEVLRAESEKHNARVCIVTTPMKRKEFTPEDFAAALKGFSHDDNQYLFDCDKADVPNLPDIKALINSSMPEGDKILYEVPTPSGGKHIITTPFMVGAFKAKYPGIHLGINRGTILYFNKS